MAPRCSEMPGSGVVGFGKSEALARFVGSLCFLNTNRVSYRGNQSEYFNK